MARIKKPIMIELTKPYKQLTLEEQRAYHRGRQTAYLEKIMADPIKTAEFYSRANKNTKKFKQSIKGK